MFLLPTPLDANLPQEEEVGKVLWVLPPHLPFIRMLSDFSPAPHPTPNILYPKLVQPNCLGSMPPLSSTSTYVNSMYQWADKSFPLILSEPMSPF